MFEKEIEFIYNYNLNKIQHLGSFISYEQLISTDIHPALLQYVSAEIDFLIYEDRQKLLQDSLFDYSGEKISEYFTNIGEEIKRSKKFSLEYLTKLLLHASSFNVNYIIRPKWSLLQFVFESENDSSKPVVEVKQILNYLYYYPYLRRLLISFFNKKRILTITLTELEELLDKIDKINYESNFDRVLDSALKNMIEFINMGESNNNKISKQSIELFLEDKNLSEYKIILTEKFGVSGTSKSEINDYKNVILAYNIEDISSAISEEENEVINQKLEELQKGVDDYDDELNGTEPNDSEDTNKNELEEISEVEEDIEDTEELKNSEIEEEIGTDENSAEGDLTVDEEDGKKSFLESHIEGLDAETIDKTDDLLITTSKQIDSNMDEMEPPDFDEAPRVDDENIEEAYEYAIEEEELDTSVDEDIDLERVELKEESVDPFNEKVAAADEIEGNLDENSESNGYIEEGNSITFSSEQLTKEEIIPSEESVAIEDDEEWPTESSSNIAKDEIKLDELLEDSEVSEILGEINGDDSSDEEEARELKSHVKDYAESEAIERDESESDEEVRIEDETNFQEALFNDNDFEGSSENSEDEVKVDIIEDIIADEEIVVDDSIDEVKLPSIDISVLLEDKKITKIIEVVFDYDMEEFSDAVDKISECKNESEALATINDIAKSLFIDESTKEIKQLKSIIKEFFK